ncbi:hypothetical protein E2I00_012395, partial [Balaenoptera physalus]
NGPSGICLSYLLSGYSPYVKPDAIHPHPVLQRKLTEAPGVSIVDQVGLSSGWEGHPHCGKTLPGKNQKDAFMRRKTKRVRDHKDLDYLSEGLEGRCQSPVALLFDALLRPDTDFGGNVDQGDWMGLPDLQVKDWMCRKRRGLRNSRATAGDMAHYYSDYVIKKGLSHNFVNGFVTAKDRSQQPFSLCARNVVLATGTSDSPARLGIPGEALPFLPKMLYPEYHKVHQMMREQSILSPSPYEGYRSLPEHQLLLFKEDRQAVFRDPQGLQKVFGIALVLVLIGSHPDLSFLPGAGADLAMDPNQPLSAKRNPVDVDPFTYQSIHQEGLYAVGPLAGDNFV